MQSLLFFSQSRCLKQEKAKAKASAIATLI